MPKRTCLFLILFASFLILAGQTQAFFSDLDSNGKVNGLDFGHLLIRVGSGKDSLEDFPILLANYNSAHQKSSAHQAVWARTCHDSTYDPFDMETTYLIFSDGRTAFMRGDLMEWSKNGEVFISVLRDSNADPKYDFDHIAFISSSDGSTLNQYNLTGEALISNVCFNADDNIWFETFSNQSGIHNIYFYDKNSDLPQLKFEEARNPIAHPTDSELLILGKDNKRWIYNVNTRANRELPIFGIDYYWAEMIWKPDGSQLFLFDRSSRDAYLLWAENNDWLTGEIYNEAVPTKQDYMTNFIYSQDRLYSSGSGVVMGLELWLLDQSSSNSTDWDWVYQCRIDDYQYECDDRYLTCQPSRSAMIDTANDLGFMWYTSSDHHQEGQIGEYWFQKNDGACEAKKIWECGSCHPMRNSINPATNIEPLVQSRLELDADSDGINNDVDNCLYDYNPGQQDSDGDGYGVECDCNDNNRHIYPTNDNNFCDCDNRDDYDQGALEDCDDWIDNDCDGLIDAGDSDCPCPGCMSGDYCRAGTTNIECGKDGNNCINCLNQGKICSKHACVNP